MCIGDREGRRWSTIEAPTPLGLQMADVLVSQLDVRVTEFLHSLHQSSVLLRDTADQVFRGLNASLSRNRATKVRQISQFSVFTKIYKIITILRAF